MMKLTRALAVPLVAAAVLAGSGAALASTTNSTTGSTTTTNSTTNSGASAAKPTIVPVHGAFADSTSWNSEIQFLQGNGYPVIAVANPLRGVASD